MMLCASEMSPVSVSNSFTYVDYLSKFLYLSSRTGKLVSSALFANRY